MNIQYANILHDHTCYLRTVTGKVENISISKIQGKIQIKIEASSQVKDSHPNKYTQETAARPASLLSNARLEITQVATCPTRRP